MFSIMDGNSYDFFEQEPSFTAALKESPFKFDGRYAFVKVYEINVKVDIKTLFKKWYHVFKNFSTEKLKFLIFHNYSLYLRFSQVVYMRILEIKDYRDKVFYSNNMSILEFKKYFNDPHLLKQTIGNGVILFDIELQNVKRPKTFHIIVNEKFLNEDFEKVMQELYLYYISELTKYVETIYP